MSHSAIAPELSGHSLTIRFPASFEVERLYDRVDALRGRGGIFAGLSAWVHAVPAEPDAPAAARLREREAARGLATGGPRLRLTLLRYRDGTGDLVIVADRGALDFGALSRLADYLMDAAPAPADLSLSTGDDRRRAGMPPARPPVVARPPWGFGEPRAAGQLGMLPAPVCHRPPAVLVAATWLVLDRYGTRPACLGVRNHAAGAGDGWVTPDLHDAVGSATVGALLERAERVLAQPEPLDRSVAQPLDRSAAQPPPVVVVLVPHRSDRRYRPVLSAESAMTISVEVGGGGGTCWFDLGMVSPQIAAQFIRHVGHVADQLATADPGLELGRVELMPAEDAAAILTTGSTPAPPVVPAHTIAEAFAAVAARWPDRAALSDMDRCLTYRELDQAAERAADRLRALGVRRGDFVGVCLDRTVDLVITLLAVLKAGAAYVPLDLHNPADRLRYIVEDAGLALVVGEPATFPAVAGVRVVPAGVPMPAGATVPADATGSTGATAPDGGAGPDAPAYVIYTSGSTGRPKGVVVPHRNVIALVAAVGDMNLSERDTWTLFHASSFDFSVWEIWGCLLTGGRLVVVPYDVTRSPAEFHELLTREAVTVLNLTPSAFTNLLEVDARSGARLAVRLLIFGGEPLDVRLLDGWFRRHPHTACRVVNMFGITETTVHVTAKTVTPLEVAARSQSVGRALPGWSVSVRDGEGRVLPAGVVGEIYVGGAGVASRYLNRDELTAQRFVMDPAGGGRVYRSGDRGRLRPDGEIEHLGRIDSQVKVRGYRIELDEIRAVLLDDPAVTAAVVLLDGEDGGDAAKVRINAYVVLTGADSAATVRRRVAGILPDYMVPASLIALPALPLTANGKLDLAQLPRPTDPPADPRAAAAGQPNHADLPSAVLDVWRGVLGVAVAPDDDFFELGGNSLLAVRLLGALSEAGLPTVSVRELYRNRTAARLSAVLDRAAAERLHKATV